MWKASSFGAVLIAAAGLCLDASTPPTWTLTHSEHFDIYSPAGSDSAERLLAWFEQLRAFFMEQPLFKVDELPPLRVVAFSSAKDYEPYSLRALSDAYYAGSDGRDYIAMSSGGAKEFQIAAHEFAHFVLHSTGRRLPPWLDEGLAEFFSSVQISERGCELGRDLPAHAQVLRRPSWLSLSELLSMADDSPIRHVRDTASLFYAQSWALADMLAASAGYAPGFQQLLTAISAGVPSPEALRSVYGKTPLAIERDLRSWVERREKPILLPGVAVSSNRPVVSGVTLFRVRSILADLLEAAGELDRAEALYRDLLREAPTDPDIHAALGTIAFRKGNTASAENEWKQAVELGVRDASVCDRYAMLANSAGAPPDEIRPALERALALRPDFDDARYRLALLEKNVGRYQAALGHFQAMRNIPPARAFVYWSSLADTLTELGQREEAITAGREAAQHAATPEERARATQIIYLAQTDLVVEFARDAEGRPQMVTTRVPHEDREDWNPFVEAGDDLQRVRGSLLEVDCAESITRIRLESSGRQLTLAIPDPSRVRMRNAPEELVCGPQDAVAVLVEYAASKGSAGTDGLVRGIEFQKAKPN